MLHSNYANTLAASLASLIILALTSCGQQSTKDAPEQQFIGKWEAHWKTDPKNYKALGPDIEFAMAGKFHFMADGQVKVKSFGYPNCFFKQDTVDNTCYWSVDANYLYIGDKPGEKSAQYYLKSANQERIEMRLLDDIELSLYQPNAHQKGYKGRK